MLRELIVDRKLRPGRPNTIEAPQLSDDAWTVIQICWEAEPTSRPTADVVCNKLSILLSVYPPVVPLPPILEKTSLNPRAVAKSLSIEDTEPISRPGSPAGSRPLPPRRATGIIFPRFRLKTLPMTEPYRTSLTLDNPANVLSTVQSSDDKVLVAGLSDGSCVVWDPNVPSKILQDIEPSFDPVTTITFDSSNSTYVVGFKSGHVTYHHKSLSHSTSHSPSTLILTGNDKPILCLHVFNIVVTALSTDSGSQDLAIIKWCLSLKLSQGTDIIADRSPLHGIAPSSCLCKIFSRWKGSLYRDVKW